MLYRVQGISGDLRTAPGEIGLFLRMLLGGTLGAAVAPLLGVREPRDVSLSAAGAGCLSFLLGTQFVVLITSIVWPGLWRGEALPWLSRPAMVTVAAVVGALAPPLIGRVVMRGEDATDDDA